MHLERPSESSQEGPSSNQEAHLCKDQRQEYLQPKFKTFPLFFKLKPHCDSSSGSPVYWTATLTKQATRK